MNYQHAYHAGCIADVFKHLVLIQLLQALHKKPAPFSYIETHTGKALYDLSMAPAQKTKEYQQGIHQLWHNANSKDPAINDYLQAIHEVNPDNTLKFYPGSSLIARQRLREHDNAILCELHPTAYHDLKNYFYHDTSVHIHHRDGYEALPALVPPKSKRGLVLIDPPYEIKDEYEQLLKMLEKVQTRWLNGIYAIWFPIKQYDLILDFYHNLKTLEFPKILTTEFWTDAENSDNALKGSGLIIINPPWQFDETLKLSLPALINALGLTRGKSKVLWLVKED